jgi:uncharacterized protein (TIGR02145 family)
MKKLLYFTLVICLTLSACSKKSDVKPNTVSINGAVYSTVVIGTQTWTTTNYNGPGGQDQSPSPFSSGKFYTFAEAQAIPLPKGWRVPTGADFDNLAILAGATKDSGGGVDYRSINISKLISTNSWPLGLGTDSLGFNALPAGYTPAPGVFGDQGTLAWFWSSTTDHNQYELIFQIVQQSVQNSGAGVAGIGPDFGSGIAASVRFVKDN